MIKHQKEQKGLEEEKKEDTGSLSENISKFKPKDNEIEIYDPIEKALLLLNAQRIKDTKERDSKYSTLVVPESSIQKVKSSNQEEEKKNKNENLTMKK